MGSHSVTCNPAEVILPTLPWHSPVLILLSCGRCKAESHQSQSKQRTHNLFDSTIQPRSCLHHLLPPPHDPELLSHLRAPTEYPRTIDRTQSTSLLSHSLLITIRPATFLLWCVCLYVCIFFCHVSMSIVLYADDLVVIAETEEDLIKKA